MNLSKFIINLILALLTMVFTLIFWQNTLLLIVLLVLIGIAMYIINPQKISIWVYMITIIFGPLSEIIAMRSGAWFYADPYILGIPLWLPFVWANTGLFILNTSDFIRTSIKSKNKIG